MDGRGDDGDHVAQIGHATDLVEAFLEGQVVGDGNLVDALAALKEGEAGLVAEAVPLAVEVLGFEEVSDAGEAFAVQQQRTYDGLFGVYIVG